MEEEKIGVLVEGTPITPEAPQPEVQPAIPLTQEAVDKLIAQKLGESEKRFQQLGDRQAAEAYRKLEWERKRGERLEQEAQALRNKMVELDPEGARDSELAQLKQERQQELVNQQTATFQANYTRGLYETLAEMGIDPKDPGLDWGTADLDFLTGQRRLLQSATKLAKEKQTKVHQEAIDRERAERKAENQRLRQEMGLDSVDAHIPPGGSSSDEDILERYARGEDVDQKKVKEILANLK